MTISDYISEIGAHSPCSNGLDELLEARTRNDVFRCLMGGSNTDFFLASVRDGWGPSAGDMRRIFGRHLGGTDTIGGAAMWCGHSGAIDASGLRRIVLFDCGDVEIAVPETMYYLKVQSVGERCRITLSGHKAAFVQVRLYSGDAVSLGPDMKIYMR